MTRYADPLRCPDCGAPITPGAAACSRCSLPLQGMTAQQLFATLSRADTLLAELRGTSTRVTATPEPQPAPASPQPFSQQPFPQPFPQQPFPSPRPSGRPAAGMSAVSVPRILLALGAGCLLVAALVFLAVTWSVLGVGGRTAVLVGFTGIAGGLATWMARRGLRAATESLALVGYGLFTLDIVGADHAGWFGDLSTAGLLALLGVLLAVTGAAGAVGVRRTSVNGLVGAEVVAAIGVGLGVIAVDLAEWLPLAVSLVVGVLIAAAAAAALLRLRLLVAAGGTAAIAAVAWLAQLAYALDRVAEHSTSWRTLWAGGHALPLLVSALLVAAPALVRRLPVAARVAAAALGQTLVGYALLAPAAHLSPTTATLVALGVLVAASAAAWLLPRPWGLVNVLTQAVTGVVALGVGAVLGLVAVGRVAATADPVWSGRAGDLLPSSTNGLPAPWLLPLCLVAALAAAWSLAEASPAVDGVATRVAHVRAAAVAALASALTATVALYPVPLWVVVAMLLATGAGFAAWWLGTRLPAPLALATGFVALGLVFSLHSDVLTAAALLALVALAVLVQLRSPLTEVAAVAGAAAAAALAGSAWTWGAILDGRPMWVALAGLVLLGAAVLAAPYSPSGWWTCDAPAFARTGLEAGAAASAIPLALAGVLLAPATSSPSGRRSTSRSPVSSSRSCRCCARTAASSAGRVACCSPTASWVRLWDLGVRAPEAYTLPWAAALLVVGALHLRRNSGASTMTALGPGLSLALVPSLLWALADPTGLRALAARPGLPGPGDRWRRGCAGPRRSRSAATVGALLVLRLAAPYVADAVPRWVLIGTAGALLVALGATWERRLTEARQLVGYVRALR